MLTKTKQLNRWIVSAAAGAILLFSCHKHHDTIPPAPSPPIDKATFWNSVAGHYKVYDSIGEFIYEMDITYIPVSEYVDSLRFENFDNNFNFSTMQGHPNKYPTDISIGFHDTLYDYSNKRWTLGEHTDAYFNNVHGDTLPLRFHVSNIKFWMYDIAPYYSAEIKQTAVKQH